MANNNCDIPGFIRDPVTGKYYRERPEDRGNSSLQKIKREVQSKTAVNARPSKITNVANILRMREIGSLNGVVAESEYCKIIIHNKKEVSNISLCYNVMLPELNFQHSSDVLSVEFITGGKNSNFGLWKCVDGLPPDYVLMERNFFNCQDRRIMDGRQLHKNIVDMSECSFEAVVSISSSVVYEGNVPCIKRSIDVFPNYGGRNTISFDMPGALYCCSGLGSRLACVFGDEKGIKVLGPNRLSVIDMLTLKARVHTLSSDTDGKLFAAGLHDGRIRFYDTNTNKLTSEIKGLEACIVESTFRENTPYAIFSGLPDKLFEVDLRTNKVVTSYYGHCQTEAKRHFSMTDNMLCTTGSDNIIRIWHMSGGSPIFEMEPIMNRDNNIRGWLNSDCNKIYLNYFEAERNIVFQII